MTPEQWEKVGQVFEAASVLEPEERSSFLDKACGKDEALRREVQSLLEVEGSAGSFLGAGAMEDAAQGLAEENAPSLAGETLGRYELLSLIGAGGMGQVYRARDMALKRDVAVKVLLNSFLQNGELLQRFNQEARAASALNHPNIVTIHEIGEVDGCHFIVGEYIEGETLRQRLVRGRVQIIEAIDVATGIAEGLAAAHTVGVIHRDIKPENIVLRPDGYVKILDFGLAKLNERQANDLSTSARFNTKSGVVMGTPRYMSPEQARGLTVDARTDVWSSGVVLYEMVAGRAPFEGQTNSDVIAAILEREPASLTSHASDVPSELQKIVGKALRKNQDERYQGIKDMLVDLKSVRRELDSENLSARIRRNNASAALMLAALVLGVAGIGYAAYVIYYLFSPTTRGTVSPSMKVVPFTSFPGREDHAAFSPDGNQIAFVWDGEKGDNPDIYVKSVGGERSLRLTSDPAIEIRPAWSPDGQRIAFVRIIPSEPSFTIFVVSALGTTPERKLLSLSRTPSTIAWSPDGEFIAISDAPSSRECPGIVLFSPETGEKRNLTSPPGQFGADSHPAFSPDGMTLAFVRENTPVTGDIHVVSVAGGEPRRVTYDNARHYFDSGVVGGLAWTADGRAIIFSSTRGGTPGLWRVAVSGGEPERLAAGGDNTYYPTISRQGHRLAYTQLFGATPVYRIKVPDSTSGPGVATRLIASTQADGSPLYSPDGKRIAFKSHRSGNPEIWVCGSEGQNPSRLTSFAKGSAVNPRWSPDGKQIAFDYREAGDDSDVYVLSIDEGVPRRITTEASDDGLPSWSRDGRWIYFASNRGGDEQVWKEPAEGGEAVQVTKHGGSTTFESADGKFLYYSKDPVAQGVWRVPVDGGEEVLVLDQPGAGVWRSWALSDDGIYFINRKSKGGPAVEFFSCDSLEIRRVVRLEGTNEFVSGLAISPDRRWILYTQQDPISSDIMLVENFY